MYLYVASTGTMSWRYDYAFFEKRKTFTLGQYPLMTLAQARKRHLELREQLSNGIDPQAEKQAKKQAIIDNIQNNFENIALMWLGKKKSKTTAKHRQDITSKLERFIYPTFRTRNINTITSKEMLDCKYKNIFLMNMQ